ncbi:MAG TPA: signal peptidase I [Planctomycetota bacterium]|nr:signal peptidase I [Planctomycetota bacterium]
MMRPRVIQRVVRFGILLGVVLAAAMFLRTWSRSRIPEADHSMEPTYPAGTRVLTKPLAPEAPLDRGTDVVYRMEKDGTTYERFGRVRALPGDEVGARDGMLTVNGEPIGPIAIPGEAMGTVPEGRVLILAINPLEETYPDSRKIGFIRREDVLFLIRAGMP